MYDREEPKTARPKGVTRALAILLALATISFGLAAPALAAGRTSPQTTVLSPEQDTLVKGGDLLVAGRAQHKRGVAGVRLVVKNLDDSTYWNGASWQAEFVRVLAELDKPGAKSVSWSYQVPEEVLVSARYRARGFAFSVDGNGDSFGGDLNEFSYRSVIVVPPDPEPCGDRDKLIPCEGILVGSSGDFRADDGSWQSARADFVRQEERLGERFAIFHEYNQWNDLVTKSWPHPETQAIADSGHIIFANWKSPSGTPADWRRIAAGEFDADIQIAAEQVKRFGDSVFLTFFHEPEDNIKRAANGDITVEDQLVTDYAAAFRHLHRRFEQAGADNVVWVWNVMGWSGHYRLYEAGLYPGDDVIDWVSYNNYNWHGCDNHGNSPKWTSFAEVYSPFYTWLEADGPGRPGLDKPFMVGEWGSEENDNAINSTQSKAEWFDDARRDMPVNFDRIKAAVYFDTEGRRSDGSVQYCEWALDSSTDSLEAFRRLLQDPNFVASWE